MGDNVTVTYDIYNIFFFTQQFITWCTRADCGSDYVAMYMKNDLTWKYKRRDRKRKEKKREDRKEEWEKTK